MFKLFGKKEGSLEEQLAVCRQKKDWAGLARACYRAGTDAMDSGELDRAKLWLHRADTIYSADDRVCKKVGDRIMDDCSERIGQLENATLLYNDIPEQVEAMAGEWEDVKVRMWGLLSLARLVKLGERLAVLPGCAVLGRLGWAVDTMCRTIQEPLAEKEFNGLRDMSGALYELGDSPDFWGTGSSVPVSGGAPFEVFDLNGMGTLLDMDAYLDAHLQRAAALSRGEEPPAPESGVIAQTLLPDYYVRTGAGKLEENPHIKAELERIWSDYRFLDADPDWDEVVRRVEEYKKLDILA